MMKSLGSEAPACCWRPPSIILPCKCPSPIGCLHIEGLESYVLFSVLFFFFPFCFRSVSCLLSVLEGTGFTITSFAQGEMGPAVVFPEWSLTLPLCPKCPHAESRGGGGREWSEAVQGAR